MVWARSGALRISVLAETLHENSFLVLVKKEEGFKLARGPLRPWGEESKTEIETEPEGGSWSGQGGWEARTAALESFGPGGSLTPEISVCRVLPPAGLCAHTAHLMCESVYHRTQGTTRHPPRKGHYC